MLVDLPLDRSPVAGGGTQAKRVPGPGLRVLVDQVLDVDHGHLRPRSLGNYASSFSARSRPQRFWGVCV